MAFKQNREPGSKLDSYSPMQNKGLIGGGDKPKKNKQDKKRFGQKLLIGENNPYQSRDMVTRNEAIGIAGTVGVGADYLSEKNQQAFRDTGQHAQNQAQGERQYKGYAKHYLKSKIKQIGKLFQ